MAIEKGTPIPVADFAARVDEILSDDRSWIAGKNVRLQRVSTGSNFTVYLVTPGTAQKLVDSPAYRGRCLRRTRC